MGTVRRIAESCALSLARALVERVRRWRLDDYADAGRESHRSGLQAFERYEQLERLRVASRELFAVIRRDRDGGHLRGCADWPPGRPPEED